VLRLLAPLESELEANANPLELMSGGRMNYIQAMES
jgi:hypothetical protein